MPSPVKARADEELQTLAVVGVSARGMTEEDLRRSFEGLPGFVVLRHRVESDTALVRFSSASAAAEAIDSPEGQRLNAGWARKDLEAPRHASSMQLPLIADCHLPEYGVSVRRGRLEIAMKSRGLDDAGAEKWCLWAASELPALLEPCRRRDGRVVAASVDFADNSVGDLGLHMILSTLYQLNVSAAVVKLYRNALGRAAANALADWIRCSPPDLAELHLSHNFIPMEGFEALFDAIALTPGYPPVHPGGRKAPLWLRIEYNLLADVRGLLVATEEQMRRTRSRHNTDGGLPDDVPRVCLIHAWSAGGCKNDYCRWQASSKGCPVVHVTYPTHQGTNHGRIPLEARRWSGHTDRREEADRWRLCVVPTERAQPQPLPAQAPASSPTAPPTSSPSPPVVAHPKPPPKQVLQALQAMPAAMPAPTSAPSAGPAPPPALGGSLPAAPPPQPASSTAAAAAEPRGVPQLTTAAARAPPSARPQSVGGGLPRDSTVVAAEAPLRPPSLASPTPLPPPKALSKDEDATTAGVPAEVSSATVTPSDAGSSETPSPDAFERHYPTPLLAEFSRSPDRPANALTDFCPSSRIPRKIPTASPTL